jgi:asparagine synthase (glutamine-hydrolysing)
MSRNAESKPRRICISRPLRANPLPAMCGIAGLIAAHEDVSCAHAQQMADRLRHRGPDDEGYLTLHADGSVQVWGGGDTDPTLQLAPINPNMGARVVLAHRRLSILDLSSAGHQPMGDESGRFWIVLNGEIYNYVELKRELGRLGHRFRTRTDTEVLLAALSEWGDQAVKRLRGMFAFAVIDRMRGEVLLARDPFGIKPLYYARLADGGFAFASEIKALALLPGVSSAPHADTLYQFLRFGLSDHGDRTMFSDIRQLPAGHIMRVRVNETAAATPNSFWSLPQRTNSASHAAEAGNIVREALSESISVHMRSDVPVGSCLSGGLDSTAIVAVASEMMPSGTAFGTVSFISDDPASSEAAYVAIAERTYRIDSHKVEISTADIRRDLSDLVRIQEAPFSSLSIYAQFAVFRAACANGLTVMLDGQGSDELLGGYNTAVSAAIAQRLARGQLPTAVSIARGFHPIGEGAQVRTVLSALGRFIPPIVAPLLMRAIHKPLCPRWLDGDWFADRGVRMAVRPQGRGRNALDQELRLFTQDLSLPQLLRYEDRNSMAFGIESRVPFCDVGFAEAVASIPTNLLIADSGQTKVPLRVAFRGLVPDEIIDRRKIGFNTPDQKWLSALKPWLVKMLNEQAPRLPFLRIERFFDELDGAIGQKKDLSQDFCRVVSTALWVEAFDIASQ